MRTEHCKSTFYKSWAILMQMWIFQELSWALWMWILWAELCESEFHDSWALQIWISWELSITNVNFLTAEHCKCEFFRAELCDSELFVSWALNLQMWKFMKAEHCESALNERRALRAEFCDCKFPGSWAEHCECEFYES